MNSSNLQMTPDWGAPIDTVKGRAANRIDPDSLEELAEKKHEILLGQIQSPAIAKKKTNHQIYNDNNDKKQSTNKILAEM